MNQIIRQAIHAECVPYDPFGGPAYGKREMPFAAIGTAIGAGLSAVAGAATAIGATSLGGALGTLGAAASFGAGAVTAGSLIGAVATVATWVGVGMTVVGAVTGDSDLMKIGGIVGLAGGVVGMGVSAINAGSSATAAATESTTGATTATTASKSAADTAFSNASNPAVQEAATQAATQSSPVLTAGANNMASQAFNAATPGAGIVGQTANVASPILSAGTEAAKSPIITTTDQTVNNIKNITKVDNQSSGFFDSLTSPTGTELIKVGSSMLQGSAQEDMNKDYIKAKQQIWQNKLDFEKQQYETMMQNANTQGQMNLTTRAMTPEEIAAAQSQKAKMAKQQAGILTQPAGA